MIAQKEALSKNMQIENRAFLWYNKAGKRSAVDKDNITEEEYMKIAAISATQIIWLWKPYYSMSSKRDKTPCSWATT